DVERSAAHSPQAREVRGTVAPATQVSCERANVRAAAARDDRVEPFVRQVANLPGVHAHANGGEGERFAPAGRGVRAAALHLLRGVRGRNLLDGTGECSDAFAHA